MLGLVIVIHDSEGMVMASSSQKIVANFTPQVAKAMAILRGLYFARDAGLVSMVVESNVVVMVKWVKEGKSLTFKCGDCSHRYFNNDKVCELCLCDLWS